jgi:hypothetical protein
MDESSLQTQMEAVREIVTGLASGSEAEACLFGTFQADVLESLAKAAGVPRERSLQVCKDLVQLLLRIAERDKLPLSHEFDRLLVEYDRVGIPLSRPSVRLPRSRPLRSFPNEPQVVHTLFVDESGTPSLSDSSQPVFSLVGVLVHDPQIPHFNHLADDLLARYGLPVDTEVHAYDCLAGRTAFASLDPARRFPLLRDFIAAGVGHTLGIHRIEMWKPGIEPEFRRQLARLRLDPYTCAVIWFNVTLQAARIGVIAFAKYRYLFDRNDKYAKSIRRIVRALRTEPNTQLRVGAIEGEPTQVDSAEHRFVQLADVIGYFLTRHRQLEMSRRRPLAAVLRHASEIEEIYTIIKPKITSVVRDRLWMMIDWQALQDWAPSSDGRQLCIYCRRELCASCRCARSPSEAALFPEPFGHVGTVRNVCAECDKALNLLTSGPNVLASVSDARLADTSDGAVSGSSTNDKREELERLWVRIGFEVAAVVCGPSLLASAYDSVRGFLRDGRPPHFDVEYLTTFRPSRATLVPKHVVVIANHRQRLRVRLEVWGAVVVRFSLGPAVPALGNAPVVREFPAPPKRVSDVTSDHCTVD